VGTLVVDGSKPNDGDFYKPRESMFKVPTWTTSVRMFSMIVIDVSQR
jgi:hypothetical protein